jgi:hypothetical protein
MSRTALLLFLALPLSATGQQPNQYAPPKTQPPDAATIEKIKAKTAELKAEIAKLPKSDFLPDVEIYAKAGEWIVMLGEWFDPKAGEKTLAVLEAGFKRAAELRELKAREWPSWVSTRGKPVIRGFRSDVDGSVQPYAVTLPSDGELNGRRLDIVLHGRDATLTEAKFIYARETAKRAVRGHDYIQVEVFGRGNNAYRWAGEADVFEAMKSFLFHPAAPGRKWVDSTKVVLRGFSMGGAGTWHLGLHYPSQFAVIGPGAGFTTTRGYVKNLPQNLPPYIERCLHIYDAVDYAENAFNVPIVAYSGEKDPQKAAADHIFDKLRDFKEPLKAVHLVAPGLEHKMPEEWQAAADLEYRKHLGRNPRTAERIRFVTYTARYGDAGWLAIQALDRHYDRSFVDASWNAQGLAINTQNIRALEITAHHKAFPASVRIDGQDVPIPSSARAVPNALFLKTEKAWRLDPAGDWSKGRVSKPEKVKELQGPIDDAFCTEFVVAEAPGRGFAQQTANQFGKNWSRFFRGSLPTKAPGDVTEEDTQLRNLILFGDAESNPLIAKVLPKLPIKWTKDELEVNGVKYDAKTHVPVLIYPNPLNPNRYVVINSGHTFRKADLKGTNALLYPRLGDWAVLKPTPTKDDPAAYEVVAAGLFDEFWQFPKK